jgi:hypothetical protein
VTCPCASCSSLLRNPGGWRCRNFPAPAHWCCAQRPAAPAAGSSALRCGYRHLYLRLPCQ